MRGIYFFNQFSILPVYYFHTIINTESKLNCAKFNDRMHNFSLAIPSFLLFYWVFIYNLNHKHSIVARKSKHELIVNGLDLSKVPDSKLIAVDGCHFNMVYYLNISIVFCHYQKLSSHLLNLKHRLACLQIPFDVVFI